MHDLQIRDLEKRYGDVAAVQSVSLDVNAGELVALLGPSGCGKTTTLRMVAGFVNPTRGSVAVKGRDITSLSPDKRDIGMVFQSYALFPHMTVSGNVAFGLKCRRERNDIVAKAVGSALELVGLTGLGDRYPRQLSGGQQQRVALARVLALRPTLLLFDEPLSNLDAKLRVQMRSEIRRLQKGVGITALFVTHDQEEAMTIADRIVIMNQGRVEQVGSPSEIYDRPVSRFVADFVGTMNILECTRRHGRLVTQAGTELPDCGDAGARGEFPVLAIRPERIAMQTAPATGAVAATITKVTRLGALVEYVATCVCGDAFIVQKQVTSQSAPWEAGCAVALSWLPDDCHFLS